MRLLTASGASVLALAVAVGCNTTPPHQNPFDPGSPGSVQAKASLAGTVSLESVGPAIFLSGIHVAIQGTGLAADTDKNGAYSISGVVPGTYSLQISKPGYETSALTGITVTLDDGEKTVSVPHVLLRVARGSLAGKVTLEGESSSAGVSVALAGLQGGVQTAADGSYAFTGVPEGIYNLSASKVAFNVATASGIQIAAGATATAPDLTLTANPGSIGGVVTLQGQTTFGGTSVVADGTTLGGNHHVATGVTDGAGHFSLTAVPAGNYAVAYQAANYVSQSAAAAVSPGGSTVLPPATLLRQTGGVAGTALLQGSTDNSGIQVTLTPPPTVDDPSPTAAAAAVTDSTGAWHIDAIGVDTYSVEYQKAGYHDVQDTVTVIAQVVTNAPPVELAPIPALISGDVSLEGGGDPSACTVSIEGSATLAAPLANGAYQLFPVGAGTQTVKFECAGYDTLRVQVVIAAAETLVLFPVTLLISRGAVHGTLIVEGRTDASGVLVSLSSGSGTAPPFTAVTDPAGSFQMRGVPIGTYTLGTALAGYAPLPPAIAVLTAGGDTAAPDPSSPASARTIPILRTAQVVGAAALEGRADASGVTIHLSGADLNGKAVTGVSDQTLGAASNTFAFTGLPQGQYAVTLSAVGFVAQTLGPLALSAGGTLDEGTARLAIARGLLAGVVTLPVGAGSTAGLLVQITQVPGGASMTASTDVTGAYSFSGVPIGSYAISLSGAGYGAFSSGNTSYPVTVAATTAIPPIALGYDTTASISGACAATGAPSQAGSSVAVSGTDFNGHAVFASPVNTASNQSFTVGGLRAGSYVVTCSRVGFTSATAPVVALAAGQAVTGVALSLPVATVALSGTVALSAGAITGFAPETDLSGIPVTITASTSSDLPKPITVVTAADGSFSMPAVPYSVSTTPYTISASRPGYLSASQPISVIAPGTPGSVALTLTVAPSSLSGTVTVPAPAADSAGVTVGLVGTAFNGAPFGVSPAVIVTSTGASSGANYTFASVPAGNYLLTFTRQGYAPLTAPATVGMPPGAGGPPAAGPNPTLARATGTVSGKVVVNDGGTSLAVDAGGVLVSITTGGSDFSGAITAVTDSSGNYAAANVPVSLTGASYAVNATKANYTSASPTTVLVAPAPAISTPASTPSLSVNAGSVTGVVAVPAPGANSGGVAATLSGIAFNGAAWAFPSAVLSQDGSSSTINGGFSFPSVPPGVYTLQLSRASYDAAAVANVTVSAGAATAVSTVGSPITLKRSTGGLSGSVSVAANGTSVSLSAADAAGIIVTVSGVGLSGAFSASTDASGSWNLPAIPVPVAPTASYTLSLAKPGYLTATGSVTPIPNTVVAVVASGLSSLPVAPSSLAGTVIASPASSQTGVSVVVSGTAFNGTAFGPTAAVLTASGGAYSVPNLPAGNYAVTFSRTGYLTQSIGATVPSYSSGSPPTVTGPSPTLVRATGTVAGSVTAQDSSPATGLQADPGGAVVAITQTSGSDLSGGTFEGITDANGNYSIPAVPVSPSGASYTVSAHKANYNVIAGPATVVVVSGNVIAPSGALTLGINAGSAGGTVSVPAPAANPGGVTATLTGTAFNGAAWSNPTTVTSSPVNGAFSFTAAPPGNYSLQLSLAGYDPIVVPGVQVTGGAATSMGNFPLHRSTGNLFGTVALNANGTNLALGAADLAGVSVTISDSTLSTTYNTSTDSSGNWAISGIPVTLPAKPAFTVTASKVGYWQASTTANVTANATTSVSAMTLNVALTTVNSGVSLVNPQPPAGNAGVVASISGIAFNGVSYSANANSVNAPGTWTLTGVPAGNYTLTLTGSATYTPISTALVVPAPPATPAVAATLNPASAVLPRNSATYTGTVQPGANGTGLTLGSGICATTPAADCAGVAISVGDPSLTASFAAISDSNGRFTISGVPLPPDPTHGYTIRASKTGYITSPETGSTVLLAAGTTLNTIALPADSSTVTGCIFVPPASGSPDSITGVTATLSGAAFNGTSYQKGATLAADPANSCGLTGSAIYTFSAVADGNFSIALARTAYVSPGAPTVTVTAANASANPLLTKMIRATGAISGAVAVSANGTGLTIGSSERANATVSISGPELTTALATVTDGNGNFVLGNIPVNVNSTYTVTVSKSHFTAGAPVAGVSLAAGSTTIVNGLTLGVTPATLTVTAEIHDFVNNGDPANTSTAGINVAVTGTAFNGAAVSPPSALTNSSAQAVFASLPTGTYNVTATYTASPHTPGVANGLPLIDGAPLPVTVRLFDSLAPDIPGVSLSSQSPTSAINTTLSLSTPSADGTLPTQNLRQYWWRRCTSTSGCTTNWTSWNGAPLPVSVQNNVSQFFQVYAEDWNGNQSQIASSDPLLGIQIKPGTPGNVRVDNRPNSVRVSWDPSTPSSSVAPVMGYLVYYGPIDGFQPSDYTGQIAAQGPSPITVSGTEITLTSLPNASPFYVAVAAFDGVVDPAPNVSNLSPGVRANPNVAPLDRAAHVSAPNLSRSLAAHRDAFWVSSGSAGGYVIDSYQYDHYGNVTHLPGQYTGSPKRARTLVADANRAIYAFDPTADPTTCGASNACGVDVLDTQGAAGVALWFPNDLAGLVVDHLVPAHRGNATTAVGHGVFTYRDNTNTKKLGTYSDFSDHVDISGIDALTSVSLHNQANPVLDIAVAGQYVFVLQVGDSANCVALAGSSPCTMLDAYTIPDNFVSAITYNDSAAVAYSGFVGQGATVVDWPQVYFTVGPFLYSALITVTPPLALGSPVVRSTLRGTVERMFVTGDMLVVAEDPGLAETMAESFLINVGGALVQSGTYEQNVPSEIGGNTQTVGVAVSGAQLFMLDNIVGLQPSAIDVVEMGGPRYMTRLGTAATNNMNARSVAARGSRALAVMFGPGNATQLHSIDMHGNLNGTNVQYARSNTYTSSGGNPCVDPGSQFSVPCNPIAVWGDYAFVAEEPTVQGVTPIDIYDVSTLNVSSAGISFGAPLAQIKASAGVTGLSAGSNYLVASVSSATHYFEYWDISDISNPTPAAANNSGSVLPSSTLAYGRSIQFDGRLVYTGTSTGFCIANIFAAGHGFTGPGEVSCVTLPGPPGSTPIGATSVDVDDKLLTLSTVSNNGVSSFQFYFMQYDVTNPASPVQVGTSYSGIQSVPFGNVRTGPYFIGTFTSSSAFEGLAGYALPASGTQPLLVGTIADFVDPAKSPPALAGPFVLVPDDGQGVAMIRMY